MANTQLIRSMQSVALEVPEGANAGTYTTLVLDITEGERIVVGAPLERGREVRLEADSPVRIQFAQPDGIYVLSSRVLGRSERDPSIHLAWPDQTELVQRRNHPRAPATLRCEVRVHGEEANTLRGTTLNLGSGGALVALPEALAADTAVRVTMELPGLGERSAEAHVLRCVPDPEAGADARFLAALGFIGILDSVRRDLSAYVFEVQREQLRRGA